MLKAVSLAPTLKASPPDTVAWGLGFSEDLRAQTFSVGCKRSCPLLFCQWASRMGPSTVNTATATTACTYLESFYLSTATVITAYTPFYCDHCHRDHGIHIHVWSFYCEHASLSVHSQIFGHCWIVWLVILGLNFVFSFRQCLL